MPATTESRRLERLSEETKNVATEMIHPEVRRAMLEIALGYRELAECARQRGEDHSNGNFGSDGGRLR